jgi:hypothetical protein
MMTQSKYTGRAARRHHERMQPIQIPHGRVGAQDLEPFRYENKIQMRTASHGHTKTNTMPIQRPPMAQPWAHRTLDRRNGPKGNIFKTVLFDRWSTQGFALGWHTAPIQGYDGLRSLVARLVRDDIMKPS